MSGYSTHDTVSLCVAEIVLLAPSLSSPAATGVEAVTVAVLMMWAASTLACVNVWFPVQESTPSVGQKILATGTHRFKGRNNGGHGHRHGWVDSRLCTQCWLGQSYLGHGLELQVIVAVYI